MLLIFCAVSVQFTNNKCSCNCASLAYAFWNVTLCMSKNWRKHNLKLVHTHPVKHIQWA